MRPSLPPVTFVIIAVALMIIAIILTVGGKSEPGAALAILSFVLLVILRFVVRRP